MEDLMRHLVTVPINQVSEEIKNPRSKFGQIVGIIQDRFVRREDHSSMKTVELQLDCMQFFLHSIPESFIEDIGPICMTLV